MAQGAYRQVFLEQREYRAFVPCCLGNVNDAPQQGRIRVCIPLDNMAQVLPDHFRGKVVAFGKRPAHHVAMLAEHALHVFCRGNRGRSAAQGIQGHCVVERAQQILQQVVAGVYVGV